MDKFFNTSFYKFLLGFSVIIIASFGVLFYLSFTNEEPTHTNEATPELAQ